MREINSDKIKQRFLQESQTEAYLFCSMSRDIPTWANPYVDMLGDLIYGFDPRQWPYWKRDFEIGMMPCILVFRDGEHVDTIRGGKK